MTTRFRTTTWPAEPVPVPAVDVPDDVKLDGEWLRFEVVSPYGSYRELPLELYLRQARDVDLEDLEAVAAFVREFGRVTPVAPRFRDLPDSAPQQWERVLMKQAAGAGREYDAGDESGALRVHVDEVILRLRILQRLTEHSIVHREGNYERNAWPGLTVAAGMEDPDLEAWRRFTDYANAALRAFHVRIWVDLGDPDFNIGDARPTVYEAAVLQLVNDLAEHVDVRHCEHCARPFSRQVGRSQHHQSRLQGVKYCSPECGRAASVKAYRARKRAERDKER